MGKLLYDYTKHDSICQHSVLISHGRDVHEEGDLPNHIASHEETLIGTHVDLQNRLPLSWRNLRDDLEEVHFESVSVQKTRCFPQEVGKETR